MKIKKISHKIMIFNTIGVLFCTFIIGLVTCFFLISEYIKEENQELNNISNGVISTLKNISYNDINDSYKHLEFGDKNEIGILIRYPDGKTAHLGDSNIIYENYSPNTWILKKRFALHFLEKSDNGINFTFIRKYSYERVIKTSEIIFYLLLVLALSIIIISYFMTKNILKPVTYIIKESEKINEKNLDVKLPKIRDDEIGDLIDIINNIFSKMQEILKNQKNFSSNISHELKTPIAIVKGYLDILKWGKNDPQLLNEGLENIEIEISNMEKLISNLLFISQSKNLKTLNEKINLYSLLIKIRNNYILLKADKKILLKCNEGINISGNYNLIFEVFRGLIDNSMKYSTGDSIFIIAEPYNEKIKIIIRDFGYGIPNNQHDKIFERFYQMKNKNSQGTKGSGLGLSIIKEIMELHNADIKIKNREDGLDVELYFHNIKNQTKN